MESSSWSVHSEACKVSIQKTLLCSSLLQYQHRRIKIVSLQINVALRRHGLTRYLSLAAQWIRALFNVNEAQEIASQGF
jgi:hypothetical protein